MFLDYVGGFDYSSPMSSSSSFLVFGVVVIACISAWFFLSISSSLISSFLVGFGLFFLSRYVKYCVLCFQRLYWSSYSLYPIFCFSL